MKIALAQFSVERGHPEINLKQIAGFAAEARAAGAGVLFLPEMCTTGFNWSKNRDLLGASGEIVDQVIRLAKTHQLSICASFLEQTESGRPANTLYYIGTEGQILAKYRKIHLFTLFHEEAHVEPGDAMVTAETELGTVGCAICYDLRFPELFRTNTLAGAVVHVLPAAFPHPRLDHWRTLIRARAIENQAFVIATNQCGFEGHGDDVGDIHYFGHSMVVDPWGTILLEAGEAPGLFFASINPGQAKEVRDHMTALQDRRPELY